MKKNLLLCAPLLFAGLVFFGFRANAANPRGETLVELEGTVQILVEDRYDDSRDVYVLQTDDGRKYEINVADGTSAALVAGARVSVSGVLSGGRIMVESGSADIQSVESKLDAEMAASQALASPNTFGAQRTVVILVNFSNNHTQPYTVAYARNIVFTSTSNFDLENSYGQTWLTGDVFGWYTIALSSTVCDYLTLAAQAQAAATAHGVNLANYTRQLYAFPQNACSWWGLGGPGNTYSQAWINGDLQEEVVAHELGHGFALQHSHSLDCGTVVLGTNCTTSEYGDIFDTMGQSAYHFNAYQKERLGWLGYGSSPPIRTVTASGTYSIEPTESTGNAPKALKIPRGTTGSYFYIELRKGIGFDAALAYNSNVMNGVLVHLASPSYPYFSDLLDMTPATYSWSDPSLTIGQSYTDPDSGVSFTVNSVSGTSASVSVTMTGPPPPPPPTCTHVSPTVSVVPVGSTSVAAGTPVSYTVSVNNRDVSPCTASTFNLQASAPAGWTYSFSPTTLSIAPGATSSTTLRVTSPNSAAAGTYTINGTVTNAGSPSASAPFSASYTVTGAGGGGGGSFSDNFNRADSGTPGNGWSVVAGSMQIVSNELRNGAVKGDNIAIRPTLTGTTQAVSADFASVNNSNTPQLGVILRYHDPLNYYFLYRNIAGGGGRKMRISKIVNGKETILANVTQNNPTVNTFFNIRGSAAGTTLTLALDGTVVLTATDATFATGAVGIDLGSSSTLSYRADNFSSTVQ